MMPDTDGITATQVIRAMPGLVRNIPIVAVTANVFDQHRQACLDVGMDAVLGKPFTTDELTAVIDRAIAGTLRPALPALDGAVFVALAADLGQEGAGMLLRTMMQEAHERIFAIRASLAADDWDGLVREAQALRAAAATVGLTGLEQSAEHLAQVSRPDAAGALEQLEQAWSAAERAVEQEHPSDSMGAAED
jgi:CheY-like chemotaxis protein